MDNMHLGTGQASLPEQLYEKNLPWHTLGKEQVETTLGTGPRGLTSAEATSRLKRYGPNELEPAPPTSSLKVLLHQFQSPLIYILLAATAVTLVLREYIDAGVIGAVLILNALIGFFQERKAEASVRALMQLVAPRARIVREGREWQVGSRDLVPGDVVLLESGARVPADIRLASTTGLMINESLLTGESVPVFKKSDALPQDHQALGDRINMAYAGSVVVRGRGAGYVVATATKTELGAIAESVREEIAPQSPLQRRMSQFSAFIAVLVGISSVAAFIIGVAIGQSPVDMFMAAVAMAVAAVPEGLPIVFTITLAVGVRRMAQRNAIIRRLPAVETLGSTTVIGSDKTGTLTQNQMVVQEVWSNGQTFLVPEGEIPAALDIELLTAEALAEHQSVFQTLLAGVLTNEASLYHTGEGVETQGDPTEVALLVIAANVGLEPEEVRSHYQVLADIPFEPERGYSASLRQRDGQRYLYVKGSPERILGMCDKVLSGTQERPLDRGLVMKGASSMAARALRVLGMAYKPVPNTVEGLDEVSAPEGLSFLGLQGMLDPPRSGVRDAVEGCQAAGMRVVMITGDHPATARAIGERLRIAGPGDPVITGAALESMSEEELASEVRRVSLFARVAPEHKLRIVRALQANGEVVAVTGDGVNDAPALRAADIGVAMGRGGTDVAREASDMVLADDNFVSIYAAVEQGRVTFENLRKVTFFLLSTGVAAIITVLVSLILGWPLPFLPAQLLWLNLVTNGLQDVALAFEPGERHLLYRKPRPSSEGILSWLLWERTALAGIVMAVGTLALFRWELDATGSLEYAQTIALTTMVFFQMFHVGNARSERRSVFGVTPWSNPFLLVAVVGALSVHVAALYLAPTQFILRVVPVSLESWVRMFVVALSVVAVVEIHKLLRGGPRLDREGAAHAATG